MPKARVAVVVDSTSTLPEHLVKQYGIHMIPQNLIWERETYADGVDITPAQFYERLKTAEEMPSTSQPSAGEFHEFFQRVAQTADTIVAVLLSEKLSGTLASAYAARDMMPDFPLEIVDTKSASMGLGFMALEAARAAEQGQDYHQVAEAARRLIPKMHVLFVVDTLEFLHRGGRIGGAARLFGSLLSMKPVLQLVDGQIEPLARIRTKRKAIDHVLEVVKEDVAGKGNVHVAVIDAAAPEDAAVIRDFAARELKPVELIETQLSPTIGANVGPGTVGIVYYVE
jgi:DegV family protein with EDD domain